LREAHMAPLADFVQRLRTKHPHRLIPDFDPLDGGVQSRVLYLEAPGRRAIDSGFVSRNNPDETAKNFFHLKCRGGHPKTADTDVECWSLVHRLRHKDSGCYKT
jgi:hypothetical protein